jgi:hypothetical protein
MTKKPSKRVREPLSPKPPMKHVDTAYLVRQDLDEEQESQRNAAAGAAARETPAPTAAAEQSPTAAMAPSKPLTPLAALWPDPVAPKPAPATAPPLPPSPAQPPSAKAPEKAAVAAPAAKSTAPQTLSVRFALHRPDAKAVSLCGEFNGWSPTATPMKRHDDGHWETTIALAPGRYEYKLIADGEWIPDPAAQRNVPNEHGSLNSVVEVRA